MESTQFKDEIEDLISKGYSSNVDFDIGSESFQHLRTIGMQIRFLKRLNMALIILVFMLCAALAVAMLSGNENSIAASKTQGTILSVAVADTVAKLKAENKLLKEKNASLQKDIKLIRKQFLSRNNEQQSSGDLVQITPPGDGLIYHEVKKGETLYSIAEKYYGDKQMYKKIISDNDLSGISDISEGKQLKIYSQQ